MGFLARAVAPILSTGALLPGGMERKTNVGAAIPTWEGGVSQHPTSGANYWRYSQEGYAGNEIVYACVEELSTSAAEPHLVVKRKTRQGYEEMPDHPVLDLFERPNPYCSRFQLIASLIMYRAIAGNAYVTITRSAAGKPVELWTLRPDRVFVVPGDSQTRIKGWEYRLDTQRYMVAPEDIIQTKYRNPLDAWYGLPPLAVCAPRVDTDAMMRSFTLAFFRNAGVPAGLLNITKQVSTAERQLIRDKFRAETGGPQNWHQLAVLDNTEAAYIKMGTGLNDSIVLPALDEISETRIAQVFGVPLELIGARLGMIHGNRSTMLAARGSFWDETLVPLYQELAADFTRGFYDEYAGTPDEFDLIDFDLSTVKALQEDDDAKHTRLRADLAAGGISVQEFRAAVGKEPEFEDDALLILARGLEPMLAKDAALGAPPEDINPVAVQTDKPQGAPQSGPPPTRNGQNGNGHAPLTADEVLKLRELIGAGSPH